MMLFKKHILIIILALVLILYEKPAQGQYFYIGGEAGAVYSWFNSPKLENSVNSAGWGYNAGFYLRYGKISYLQVGFDWTRSKNDFIFNVLEEQISEEIEFHNFDFSLKFGYNFIHTPIFKMKVYAGPFIGRSFLFSGNIFEFTSDDFKNPQLGMISGIGFQFMNFVGGVEYSYHFTDLFNPVIVDGQEFKFGSNLQLLSLKFGVMF